EAGTTPAAAPARAPACRRRWRATRGPWLRACREAATRGRRVRSEGRSRPSAHLNALYTAVSLRGRGAHEQGEAAPDAPGAEDRGGGGHRVGGAGPGTGRTAVGTRHGGAGDLTHADAGALRSHPPDRDDHPRGAALLRHGPQPLLRLQPRAGG